MSVFPPDTFSGNENRPGLASASYARREFGEVPGLWYVEDFVSAEEEQGIVARLDSALWSTELERRVQHYGFKYNYKTRRVDESMRVGELPEWMKGLGARLVEIGAFSSTPDQAIVNEYLPGQGIAPHIDCEPCFGDTVASVTLCSGSLMEFTHKHSRAKISVWLAPRSAVVLTGEARYDWLHGITKRKSDIVDGVAIRRERRISLTYRTIVLN